MPDKSFVDINYTIKQEMKEEKEENSPFFSLNYQKIKESEINLDLIKHSSTNTIKKKEEHKKITNFFNKKYYTPSFNPKASTILPQKFQLNPNEEEDEDLAQKIFSKIFNKSSNKNLNNSIEIITSKEIKEINNLYNSALNLNEFVTSKYETFCISIFISGIKSPIENGTIIENSCNFVSICGHKNCSLLLSLKPELILTYSNKNSSISKELNYLVANLCFPLGIKICFEKQEENIIKDKKIVIMQNNVYYNVMKNEKDKIFYLTTLLYFIKMKIKDFKEKYKFDLISYYSQLNNNSIKKENNLKKGISLISKLSENDEIYVPETISLLSKYPFFIPMKICLNKIISLQTQEEKNKLINHIINEIPIPQRLKQIQFYIPYDNNPIILNNYFNLYKGLSIINESNNIDNLSMTQLNSKLLLEIIPIENIIILFQLILLEQQILIIENNYNILSEIILILITIIYPLSWTNPFLPTLSLNTFQFLQTPVPYIMGIDEYLLNYAYNSKNIYIGKDIIIYNLMKKYFILSRTRKKANKKDIIHEFKLNFLPEKIEKFMNSELKQLKILMGDNKMNDIKLDMEIRLVFAKAMILLIGDYNNYTFYKNNDDMPLFNKEAFIESHKDKQIKLFYSRMTNTQLFNQFLLNESQIYFYNINKNNISNINLDNHLDENFDINNCIDTTYFKKMIEKYPELINNETIRKSSLDLDFNTRKKNGSINYKRSKSNRNLKLLFEIKKDIPNPNDNVVRFNEKKLTIDFNKFSFNSPEIKQLTKSHNFKLPMNDNNNSNINDNELNIKKSQTTKYNNIIIKKPNKIKKYLIYPYFLPQNKKEEVNSFTLKIIKEKIYEYNKEHINTSDNLKYKTYILQKSFILEPEKMNQKNHYIIDLNNNINYISSSQNINETLTENNPLIETNDLICNENPSSKNIKEHKKNHKRREKKSKSRKLKNELQLSPKFNFIENFDNNEDIELINKCFISCCTNKNRITNEQFAMLEKIFAFSYNKSYFANLIIPDIRIKNRNEHKQLISTSFEDFKRMMKMCLEKLTHEEKEIGRLFTIACFSYYKIDKEKNIFYLYQCFNEGVIYPCKLWLIDEFWMEFFSIEMNEASQKEDELIKNYDNNTLGEFDNDKSIIEFKSKFALLTENSLYMSKIMIKLNLNQIFIMNVFEKMILPVYESDYYNINIISKKILSLFNCD